MDKTCDAEVLIVGAGVHGLVMAKTYLEVYPSAKVLVVDSSRTIGGVWAQERIYPGLKTNNVVGTYEFGDFPMAPEKYGLEAGDFIPGEVVHRYLTDYATRFGLMSRIELSTKVVSASLREDGHWSVRLERLEEQHSAGGLKAKHLVIATGLACDPKVPSFQGQEGFRGELYHNSELPSRIEGLRTKTEIVVIGGNKSAWDACYLAARMGVRVRMVIRPSGGGPSYALPKSIEWGPFTFSLGHLVAMRLSTPADPYPFGSSSLLRWIRKLLHRTTLGRMLAQLFWARLDRRIKDIHGYRKHPETAKLEPWHTTYWASTAVSSLNYDTNWFDLVKDGAISVHIAHVSSVSSDGVLLSDGELLPAEAIVCCTGWKLGARVALDPPEAAGTVIASGTPAEVQADTDRALRLIRRECPELFTLARRTSTAPEPDHNYQAPPGDPFLLYRSMVPVHRPLLRWKSIAYMGVHGSVPTVLVSQVQALWITAFLNDKISHLQPASLDLDAVRASAVMQRTYHQLRRPRDAGGVGGKHTEYIFDTLDYVDALVSDLELETMRKRSWWRDVCTFYGAADYADLAQEWMMKNKLR